MEKRKNDYRRHILLEMAGRMSNLIVPPIFYSAVVGLVMLLSFVVMSFVLSLLF